MAKKKTQKKHKKTIEHKMEQPVHNLIGYGVLFAFCVIVLLVVLNNQAVFN